MIRFITTKIRRYFPQDESEGIIVQVLAPPESAGALEELLAKHVDGELEVTIQKPSNKRTLTANNYLWILCDEIASALETDKEAVYKALIRRVGVFSYILVKRQAAKRFRDHWEAKGIGWFADELVYHDPAVAQFAVYYGSSTYTREELSRVIREAEDEAIKLGENVKNRQVVKELLESWQ